MTRKPTLILVALFALLWQPHCFADDVPVIAAASDLSYALGKVVERFTRETGRKLRVSFGSSGNLMRMIEQGGPFEMFMSADENYVFRLAGQGQTVDRGRIYALGRLALFAPRGSALEPSLDLARLPDLLADGRVRKFAIANPLHAPYGKAAREALLKLNLWQDIENALVFGESASQATLFAASGSTQGAIIPHSLALNPGISAKGSFRLIDRNLHNPLRQRMVLLKNASDTARQFYDYMQTTTAQEILGKSGFTIPGDL
ncbi:MAG: molybdate ABC transporter substrate-binding protein [Gammaproteobacteria bacterium]|nr:molybdate ABC transporter substrate-binding protein [Gammaproteobacteria bacterium]